MSSTCMVLVTVSISVYSLDHPMSAGHLVPSPLSPPTSELPEGCAFTC